MTPEDYIAVELAHGRLTNSHIAALTRNFQRSAGLEPVDGKPGTATRAALDNVMQGEAAQDPTEDRLEEAGKLAVAEALRLFSLDVYDPPVSDNTGRGIVCKQLISRLMADVGWGNFTPYRGDPTFQWCGIFVANAWKAAGLNPKWLRAFFSSTYRLGCWAGYRDFGEMANPLPDNSEPRRMVAYPNAYLNKFDEDLPFTPRAGDILTIGDGLPSQGDHICLVESFDPTTGIFRTIEGNGHGKGPDGKDRQGIVRAERHLGGSGYCARMLIRPASTDLV